MRSANLAWARRCPRYEHQQSGADRALTTCGESWCGGTSPTHPCYDSRRRASTVQAQAPARPRCLPPVYDRAGLKLTAEERARLEAEASSRWRFLLDWD